MASTDGITKDALLQEPAGSLLLNLYLIQEGLGWFVFKNKPKLTGKPKLPVLYIEDKKIMILNDGREFNPSGDLNITFMILDNLQACGYTTCIVWPRKAHRINAHTAAYEPECTPTVAATITAGDLFRQFDTRVMKDTRVLPLAIAHGIIRKLWGYKEKWVPTLITDENKLPLNKRERLAGLYGAEVPINEWRPGRAPVFDQLRVPTRPRRLRNIVPEPLVVRDDEAQNINFADLEIRLAADEEREDDE